MAADSNDPNEFKLDLGDLNLEVPSSEDAQKPAPDDFAFNLDAPLEGAAVDPGAAPPPDPASAFELPADAGAGADLGMAAPAPGGEYELPPETNEPVFTPPPPAEPGFTFGAEGAPAQAPTPAAAAPSAPAAVINDEDFAPPAQPSERPAGPGEHPLERVEIPAAFPFSLMIEGELSPEEREKLLDVLSRENMGVREVDLEPQFASHRVLIPRISEYAGVRLIQALRGTRARMRLGPSDSIFATDETRDASAAGPATSVSKFQAQSPDLLHPAESLPVSSLHAIPELPSFSVLDTVSANAMLKAKTVEVESSSEYQEILEALQRELKYKAYRKGATAILGFSVQLLPLNLQSGYRIFVSGTAVKAAEAAMAPQDSGHEPDLTH